MRFVSININNYRQYKDVLFEFKKTKYDIHIIIASNGVGKTNLLNAINWCLYGDEPHASGIEGVIINDTSLNKLPICNLKTLEDSKAFGEEKCPVKVTINAEDEGKKYIFRREINVNSITRKQIGKDDFSVQEIDEKGTTNFLNEDMANDLINKFLPKSIREYFYFDGERLLNYFDNSSSKAASIKDSIYEISQVNVINSVEKHLEEFRKDYSKQLNKHSPELEKKGKIFEESKELIENKKKEIELLKGEIQESKEQIKIKDDFINGTESVVEDNHHYNRNLEKIEKLRAKLEDAKLDLALFVRNYSKLIFLYGLNSDTFDYIKSNTEDSVVNPVISMGLIKDSLEEHKCRICGSELNEAAEEYLENLVNTVNSNKIVEKLFEIKNDIKRSLAIQNYEQEKNYCFNEINSLEDDIKSLEDENYELSSKISRVSGVDEISDAIEMREYHHELYEKNNIKLGRYQESLKGMIKDLAKNKESYNKAIEENKEVKKYKKRYKFVSDAKKIVENIKAEIVDDVKIQMETKTIEIFQQLLWKNKTFSRIELDDNFNLKLFHEQTDESCLNSCSAAEKELLALAFTLALHQVSGYDNLLFIDTPVGRVSDNNRENFAKVLLEVSEKKQIILAFTPSEYSSEIKEILRRDVVSSYNYLENDEINAIIS